jgi:hypothetical protein
MRFHFLAACLLVESAVPAAAQAPVQAPIQAPVMASYRAVYDLALKASSGERGLESGRGRIVLEFTGNECEGYALSFRQVTDLSGGEIGRKISDLRSTTYEDGEGKTFRFNSETRQGPRQGEITDGVAERMGGKLAITLRKPKPSKLTLSGDIAFPTQHLKELVVEARAGNRTFNRRVYDGSDDSNEAYDTFAIIGAPKKDNAALEADIVKAGWDKLSRWPVSISFFEPEDADKPAYVLSYELFENGFGRALKIDYGTFAFNGTLTKLELMPSKPCKK